MCGQYAQKSTITVMLINKSRRERKRIFVRWTTSSLQFNANIIIMHTMNPFQNGTEWRQRYKRFNFPSFLCRSFAHSKPLNCKEALFMNEWINNLLFVSHRENRGLGLPKVKFNEFLMFKFQEFQNSKAFFP